jgi:Uri superfamily endonuclease
LAPSRLTIDANDASAGDLNSAAVVNTLDAPVPTEPGAYLLIIETSDPVPLKIRTLATAALPAGRYAYAGSACGPGGIRARVLRHLKADKKRHWHIDHLTAVVPPFEVIAFPGRNECDILARPGASIPVLGFGSSDCRDCPAHLVQLVGLGDFTDFLRHWTAATGASAVRADSRLSATTGASWFGESFARG